KNALFTAASDTMAKNISNAGEAIKRKTGNSLIGINNLSGSNKGMGWTLIGSGFVASIAGGYFTLVGQNHLLSAVDLFNSQYKKSTVSLGLGKQSAGLVYKF
ncbi:MAG: hypothetical protein B7Z27_03095, partial [Sphingobacteriia bacterium 32-37-4]